MPRYQPKELKYPQKDFSYQIVTPSGVVSCIYDDVTLAQQRFEKMPYGWKILKVCVIRIDVTPRRKSGGLHLVSNAQAA